MANLTLRTTRCCRPYFRGSVKPSICFYSSDKEVFKTYESSSSVRIYQKVLLTKLLRPSWLQNTSSPLKDDKSFTLSAFQLVSDVLQLSSQACVDSYEHILSSSVEGCLSTNDIKILNHVQMQIFKYHVHDLSVETLFQLIEKSCLQLYKTNLLEKALLIRLTEEFERCDINPNFVTRVMFVVGLFKSSPRSLLDQVHTYVCDNFTAFSPDQLAVIMSGYHVANVAFPDDFLLKVITSTILKNVDSMQPEAFLEILRSFHLSRSHKSKFYQRSFYKYLAEVFRSEEKLKSTCCNITDVCILIKIFSVDKFKDEKLLEVVGRLVREYYEGQKTCRMKDISTLSWTLGTLAYDVENSTGIYSLLEEMFRAPNRAFNLSSESLEYHKYALEFFFGLAVAERFPLEFIQYMQQHRIKEVVRKFLRSERYDRNFLAILLASCMAIDCQEVAKTMPLESQYTLRDLYKWSIEKSSIIERDLEQIQKSLTLTFGEGKVHLYCIVPYRTKDLEVCLDHENRPVKFKPQADLRTSVDNFRRIVIVISGEKGWVRVTGQSHTEDSTPDGTLRIRLRHLKKLGHHVCLVKIPISDKTGSNPVSLVIKELQENFNMQLGTLKDVK